ncbi:hypothetical protein [Pacificispira sp.]|uniref:hypothetical protein n=1 Tax=Pacificispira sp. TaxID=2888761 RepID=UPI003BABD8F5
MSSIPELPAAEALLTPAYFVVHQNGSTRKISASDFLGSMAGQGADNVVITGGTGVFQSLSSQGQFSVFGAAGSLANCLKATYDANAGVAWFGPDSSGGNTQIRFGTSNAGVFAERMRIAADGTFTMNGNVNMNGRRLDIFNISDPSNQGLRLGDNISGKLWNIAPNTTGGLLMRFYNGSTWLTRLAIDAAGVVSLGGAGGAPGLKATTVDLAVNFPHVAGAPTGSGVRWLADGADGSVKSEVYAKGAAPVEIGNTLNGWQVSFGVFGGGDRVQFIRACTAVPSTDPTGGGYLFVDAAGALKYRGPAGTVTEIAPA